MSLTSQFLSSATLGLAVGLAGAAHADESTSRWLSPTMLSGRANMFAPDLNFLTFQHMDKVFATRTVAHGDMVWTLPKSPVSLDGTYTILGETHDL